MTLTTIDAIVKRVGDGFCLVEQIIKDLPATATTVFTGGGATSYVVGGYTVPSMPSGVSAFIPTQIIPISAGTLRLWAFKVIDLGSLSLATPTFTDGSAMPTVTELGVSRQIAGPVIAEVETAFNATPGNFTVTYVDQDGNGAETIASTALTASATVGSVSALPLNSPDWGVQDITTATRTGGTTPSGVVRFWGCIPLGYCLTGLNAAGNPTVMNFYGQCMNPTRLAAGDRIRVFAHNSGVIGRNVLAMQFVGDTP